MAKDMLDLRQKTVQIQIANGDHTIWVNTENGCVLRIQGIEDLSISRLTPIKEEDLKEGEVN